jgi:hypothetical protein
MLSGNSLFRQQYKLFCNRRRTCLLRQCSSRLHGQAFTLDKILRVPLHPPLSLPALPDLGGTLFAALFAVADVRLMFRRKLCGSSERCCLLKRRIAVHDGPADLH